MTFEYPSYDFSQLVRQVTTATPVRESRKPDVPKTVAEQDTTVQGIAEAEIVELEAQGEGG
jgi:hypothetical protein